MWWPVWPCDPGRTEGQEGRTAVCPMYYMMVVPRKVPAPCGPSCIFQEWMSPTSPIQVPGAILITPRDPCSHSPRTGHLSQLSLQMGISLAQGQRPETTETETSLRGGGTWWLSTITAPPADFSMGLIPQKALSNFPGRNHLVPTFTVRAGSPIALVSIGTNWALERWRDIPVTPAGMGPTPECTTGGGDCSPCEAGPAPALFLWFSHLVWHFASRWVAVHWLSCASLSPGVCSDSCSLSQRSHPTILSSVVPFSACLPSLQLQSLSQWLGSLLPSEYFTMSQLFPPGGQSIGDSASASVLPMNTQDWSPLGGTGWISSQSKGLSRVFFSTTIQKHQFFGAQHSLGSSSYINTWLLEKP